MSLFGKIFGKKKAPVKDASLFNLDYLRPADADATYAKKTDIPSEIKYVDVVQVGDPSISDKYTTTNFNLIQTLADGTELDPASFSVPALNGSSSGGGTGTVKFYNAQIVANNKGETSDATLGGYYFEWGTGSNRPTSGSAYMAITPAHNDETGIQVIPQGSGSFIAFPNSQRFGVSMLMDATHTVMQIITQYAQINLVGYYDSKFYQVYASIITNSDIQKGK